MKEIPLKAKVQCSDSPCGKSTNVILNKETHQVTHVAIEDKKLPDNPTRLVPIDKVASASHEQITLNCTRDEVTHMEPFVISQVIQETGSGSAYASGTSEYVVDDPGYDVVHMEQVPAGEMALTPGTKISASGHTVGKLDELCWTRRVERSHTCRCARDIFGARRTWLFLLPMWTSPTVKQSTSRLTRRRRRHYRPCRSIEKVSKGETGDASAIAGYLGKGKSFDRAVANFAMSYADQTERDYQLLVEAVDAGRIVAAKSI